MITGSEHCEAESELREGRERAERTRKATAWVGGVVAMR